MYRGGLFRPSQQKVKQDDCVIFGRDIENPIVGMGVGDTNNRIISYNRIMKQPWEKEVLLKVYRMITTDYGKD